MEKSPVSGTSTSKLQSEESPSSSSAVEKDGNLSWIPVESDEECIPRIRRVSSSSSSSAATDVSSSANEPMTEIPGPSPSKIIEGEGKVKGWTKEPLSIMWCLNSFDNSEDAASPNTSRVLLYDQKTVMAVENPSTANGQSTSSSKKSKTNKGQKVKKFTKKMKKSNVKVKRPRKRDDSFCQSCDSIDSSPTNYRNDSSWTGYKLKKDRISPAVLDLNKPFKKGKNVKNPKK